jgi:MFS family permease
VTGTLVVPPVDVRRRERRDVGLLAAGMTVSVAGDAAAVIALLLELRTAGVGWVSAVLAAELLPFVIFASYSGRLVDRVDNRRLLVGALLGQALVVLPLAFVRAPWLVVLLVFLLATVSTVVRPAVSAMIPALAGDEHAPKAYAWVATGSSIGWIIGPAAGGVLTSAFGVGTALVVDAVSFGVLALACSLLSTSRSTATELLEPGARLGGMTILWRDAVLRWSVVVTAVVVACAVVDNVAAPFRFVDELGTTSAGYGAYLALWGVGALAGAQLPRRLGRGSMPVALAIGNLLCGLGILGIGLAPGLAVAYAASAFGGIGNGIANVAMSALVASRVRAHERGRAFASVGALVQSGTGLGTIAGAPLVAVLGAGRAMVAAGAVSSAVAAATAGWARRREARPLPHPPPNSPAGSVGS